MLRSHDDLIRIDVSKKVLLGSPGASDFSIVNLPSDENEASYMLQTLYNTPSTKHITLLLTRHSRREKVQAMSNIALAPKIGFQYLDTVTIWYEKPSSCSNRGFLPVTEIGHIFYKGVIPPDVKQTEWFGDGTSNATNLWGVTPQEDERKQVTYCQRFCWEVPLLLMSLSRPLEYRRFIYATELSDIEIDSFLRFCKKFSLGTLTWAPSDQVATQWIRLYNELK